MNRAGLRCGLMITVPGKEVVQTEADTVFRLGQKIMHGGRERYISYPVFVLLADYYKMFAKMNSPVDNGTIGQNDMI